MYIMSEDLNLTQQQKRLIDLVPTIVDFKRACIRQVEKTFVRQVSEETYVKLIVNQKRFGCLGTTLEPFTMTEREAIIANLEKRGWVDYNTVNVITEEGERVARQNIERYGK